MVTCACTRDVEQMTLGIVHVLQIAFVGDALDPRLERQHLVVARHHGHGAKLQPFAQVHCPNGHAIAQGLAPGAATGSRP